MFSTMAICSSLSLRPRSVSFWLRSVRACVFMDVPPFGADVGRGACEVLAGGVGWKLRGVEVVPSREEERDMTAALKGVI